MEAQEAQYALIAEQLSHTIDLLRSELEATRQALNHHRDLADHRLKNLEKARDDHESRLRQVQDAATQYKLLASLATGGGLLSLIALIKALMGA